MSEDLNGSTILPIYRIQIAIQRDQPETQTQRNQIPPSRFAADAESQPVFHQAFHHDDECHPF
jgi:hypothetical protein